MVLQTDKIKDSFCQWRMQSDKKIDWFAEQKNIKKKKNSFNENMWLNECLFLQSGEIMAGLQ